MVHLLVGQGVTQRIVCSPAATPAPRRHTGSVSRRTCVGARHIAELRKQLAQAVMIAGRPDLTISEAQSQRVLDWRRIHAA
jgi:hypothetical protein